MIKTMKYASLLKMDQVHVNVQHRTKKSTKTDMVILQASVSFSLNDFD